MLKLLSDLVVKGQPPWSNSKVVSPLPFNGSQVTLILHNRSDFNQVQRTILLHQMVHQMPTQVAHAEEVAEQLKEVKVKVKAEPAIATSSEI